MLIDRHGSNGIASDVFIHDTRNEGKIVTVLAETGQFIKTNGAPSLVLQNGQRVELTDDTNNSAVLYFDSHTMSIAATGGSKSKRMPIDMNEDTISNLLDPAKSPSPNYFYERRAEGHYRIMSPFLGFALILLRQHLPCGARYGVISGGSALSPILFLALAQSSFSLCHGALQPQRLNLFRCSMPVYLSQLPFVFGH